MLSSITTNTGDTTHTNGKPAQALCSVTILFGVEAVLAYETDECGLDRAAELGSITTYTFSTMLEREAFLTGVSEAVGWLECTLV